MSGQLVTDTNALNQYIDMMGEEGAEFIVDIIDTFLEDAPKNLRLLSQCLETDDPVTFRRAAHTLKTGCATVGATAMAAQFLELEHAGAEQNLAPAHELLKKCKVEFQALSQELLTIKNNLPA
jgi:HPt (histidine-containing phosphotransfer) domain-containing protein